MTALIQLGELKEYLTITSNTYDNKLSNIIVMVSSAIESYCGREFHSQYVSELHDGGRSSIFVNRIPVNNVNSVMEYNGMHYVPLTGPNSTGELPNLYANATQVVQYTYDGDTGQFSRNTGEDSGFPDLSYFSPTIFADYKRGVKIEYNGGYDSIPNDLKIAALDYSKLLYKQEQDSKNISFQGETKESHGLSKNFPPHIKRILDFYRILN